MGGERARWPGVRVSYVSLTYSGFSRRRALGLIAAAAAAPAIAGCQSVAPETTSGSGAPAAGFPVTIEHARGSTTLEAPPTKIITVGFTDHEFFLALGVRPVGVRAWFGEEIDHTWPWIKPAWGDTEVTYIGSQELDYEKIATLAPDVIVGLYAELEEDVYTKLTAIAPTVAEDPDSAPYTTDRAVMFRNAAKIIGKSAEADQILAGLDERFAAVRKDHPEFAEQTAAVVDPGQQTFYAFGKDDPRGRFLSDLGYAAPDEVNKIIGDQFGAEISPERIDVLDLDRLVLLADAETRQWLAANKLYQQLTVTKDKRTLEIPYYEEPFAGAAMAYNTPLSVPYALDNLVPQLAGR